MRFQFTLLSLVASIAGLAFAAPTPIVAAPALNRRGSTIKTVTPAVNPNLSGASGAVILPDPIISNSSSTLNPPPTGVNSTTNSTAPFLVPGGSNSTNSTGRPHFSPASGGIVIHHHNSTGNGTIGKIGTTSNAHQLASNSSSPSNSTSGAGDKKKGKGGEKKTGKGGEKKTGKGDEKKKEAEKKKAEKKKEEEKKAAAVAAASAGNSTAQPTGDANSTALPSGAAGDGDLTILGAHLTKLPTVTADSVRRLARRSLFERHA